jgi:hypothetical protein
MVATTTAMVVVATTLRHFLNFHAMTITQKHKIIKKFMQT